MAQGAMRAVATPPERLGKEKRATKAGKRVLPPLPEAPPGRGAKPSTPPDLAWETFSGKCKHGAVLSKGVKCDYGVHRKAPRDEDKERPFFKRLEEKHGQWASGKFHYPDGSAAVPAILRGGSPPGSPRSPQPEE